MGDGKVSLLEACHENWIKAFEWVASVIPGGMVERTGGVVIVRTGLPSADFNLVFAFDRPRSLEDVAQTIDRIFARTGTPWELITTPESSEEMKPLIRDMELVRSEVMPGSLKNRLIHDVDFSQPRHQSQKRDNQSLHFFRI